MSYYIQFKGDLDLNFKSKTQKKKIHKRVDELETGWTIEDTKLKWDESKDSANYLKWLKYILTEEFAPENIIANGTIRWLGEDMGDSGEIIITDNHLSYKGGRNSEIQL